MNWLQFLFVVLLRISLFDISDWANLIRGHSLDSLRCCDMVQDLTLLICMFATFASKFLNILIRKWMPVHWKLEIHEIARLYSVWYCWVQLLSKHSYEGCHRGSICIILTSSLSFLPPLYDDWTLKLLHCTEIFFIAEILIHLNTLLRLFLSSKLTLFQWLLS